MGRNIKTFAFVMAAAAVGGAIGEPIVRAVLPVDALLGSFLNNNGGNQS